MSSKVRQPACRGARIKRRLRIRNCFRLAKIPCIELTNPCQFLNGCQSFPVLGLVARRKVSGLVARAWNGPGPWQDLPQRHGDDNNVNLGTNVGFVSGLQATRTRVQEMIFRAEKDRFFSRLSQPARTECVDVILKSVLKKVYGRRYRNGSLVIYYTLNAYIDLYSN